MSRVSVVVVHHRGRDILLSCLESLRAQTERDFEVVLVANGVADGSVEPPLPPLPAFRIVCLQENAGFAGGANAGIRACQADLIALLNDDARAEPSWLASLLEAADRHPWVSAFASRVLQDGPGRLIDSAGDLLTFCGEGANRGHGEPDGPCFDSDCEVFGVSAGAALYRRAFFDRVGLFDERFFHTYEDFDLALRARLAGERSLYVSAARVTHIGGATRGAASADSIYYQARNSELAFWPNLPAPLFWRALPWHLARGLWGVVAKTRQGSLVPYLRGKAAALGHFPRLLALRRDRIARDRR